MSQPMSKITYASGSFIDTATNTRVRFSNILDSVNRSLLPLDDKAKARIREMKFNVTGSKAENDVLLPESVNNEPENKKYMPFQRWGIYYMAQQLRHMNAVGLFDCPGLGKTIQAIGLANHLYVKKFIVVCPSGLRLNWESEIQQWFYHRTPIQIIRTGNDIPLDSHIIVCSYSLLDVLFKKDLSHKLVFVDEAHYLKNLEALRTKQVLGVKKQAGIVTERKAVFISGTPAPNRVHELWPLLIKTNPYIIDYQSYAAFQYKYLVTVKARDTGRKIVIKGQNLEDLNLRLRASGFMLRRRKEEVLTDLPDKGYKLVTIEGRQFTAVLKEEAQFNPEEVHRNCGFMRNNPGVIASLRLEMGRLKVPFITDYVRDLLEDSEKAIIFCHHREVVAELLKNLKEFNPVSVVGGTSLKKRDEGVKAFMQEDSCRLFIGNIISGGVGLTLTSASDVVMAETSWVPGENEQAIDRAHRISQLKKVLAHFLVVKNSLDAYILRRQSEKLEDLKTALK